MPNGISAVSTKSGKYTALRRSQIVIAMHVLTRELEHLKFGGKRHVDAARQRTELLDELQKRDSELIARFEKGILYGFYPILSTAQIAQSSQRRKIKKCHSIKSKRTGRRVTGK